MTKIIDWLYAKRKAAALIATGLIALLFWSNRRAVESYKDKLDEEANRRASAANDAAAAANRLSPDDIARRMQREGWYRD